MEGRAEMEAAQHEQLKAMFEPLVPRLTQEEVARMWAKIDMMLKVAAANTHLPPILDNGDT